MKKRKKMVWIVLGSVFGLLAVAGAVAFGLGSSLPVAHTASVTKTVKASPEEVWKALTDIDGMPSWRKELKSIQRTEGANGLPRWVEKSSFGDIPLQVELMEESAKLVTRIDDQSLPFGGRWTYSLEPEGNQTRLTITEDGEVRSPLFRFMSKYIFGHTKTLQTFADQLAAKFEGSLGKEGNEGKG